MNEYKAQFKGGGTAGFPAKDLKEAHKIALDWADGRMYKIFRKTTSVKGWLYVGGGK